MVSEELNASDLDTRLKTQARNECLLVIRDIRNFIYKNHVQYFDSLFALAETHGFLDSLTSGVNQMEDPPLNTHWIIV
jgi:hypothetical protein